MEGLGCILYWSGTFPFFLELTGMMILGGILRAPSGKLRCLLSSRSTAYPAQRDTLLVEGKQILVGYSGPPPGDHLGLLVVTCLSLVLMLQRRDNEYTCSHASWRHSAHCSFYLCNQSVSALTCFASCHDTQSKWSALFCLLTCFWHSFW